MAEADSAIEPKHYNDLSPTPIEVIDAWGLGFCLGNTVKYISRAGKKDGESTVRDLKKARWYLDHEIETLERSNAKG
jgi:hypothetical protein